MPHALRLFTAEEARFDAMDVSIALGSINGTDEEVRRFVDAVPRTVLIGSEETGDILNRPSNPRNYSKFYWNVTKRPSRGAKRPLLAGRLELVRDAGNLVVTPGEAIQFRWNLNCQLKLNPTRWLRHQPLEERGVSLDVLPNTVRLFETELEPSDDGENDLEQRADNVLLGAPQRYERITQDNHFTQLASYLQAVANLFRLQLLRPATSVTNLSLNGPVTIKINKLEVYWELAHVSPVETVQGMEPRLRSMAQRTVTGFRTIPRRAVPLHNLSNDLLFGRINSSASTTVHVENGISVKVYAKTNRRIRFEVAFDTRKSRQRTGRMMFTDISSTIEFMRNSATTGLVVFQMFVEGLLANTEDDGAYDPLVRQLEPHELFFDIVRVIEDREMARWVVSSLVLYGSVSSEGRPDRRSAIRRLMYHNILRRGQRHGRSYFHLIHIRYADGLAALRRARQLLS
jgi:hypothetical protein